MNTERAQNSESEKEPYAHVVFWCVCVCARQQWLCVCFTDNINKNYLKRLTFMTTRTTERMKKKLEYEPPQNAVNTRTITTYILIRIHTNTLNIYIHNLLIFFLLLLIRYFVRFYFFSLIYSLLRRNVFFEIKTFAFEKLCSRSYRKRVTCVFTNVLNLCLTVVCNMYVRV